jgi:hyperosmotically inducible protein
LIPDKYGEDDMKPSSEKIKTMIIETLDRNDRINKSDIQVDVKNGDIRLSGTVPLYYAKQAAEKDVLNIPGVKSVKNDLEVRYTIRFSTDENIKSSAEETLAKSPEIDSNNIKVHVSNGFITLRGSVKTYIEKYRAGLLISDMIGVMGLENELTVVQ